MARMSGIIGRVMLLAATAGASCRDLAQAPNPPPIVGESAFRTFLLDHEFNVDYGAGFARPTVLFEGPSSISVVYGDFDQGTVKYAGCASSCGDTTSWHLGVVDSSGYDPTTVLTTTGLHTIYSRAVNTTLKLEYTYCPGGCMVSRHWSRVPIDTASYPVSAALASDPSGGLHVVYGDFLGYRVRYAECPGDCLSPGNWGTIDLAQIRTPLATITGEKNAAIAVDAAGAIHVAYSLPVEGLLRYAVCTTACTDSGFWISTDIDFAATIGTVAMTLDSAGAVNVVYIAGPSLDGRWSLRLARCSSGCDHATAWNKSTVSTDAAYQRQQDVAITSGPAGTLHLAFLLAPDSASFYESRDIAYATCTTACADSTHWQRLLLGLSRAQAVAVAVDPGGRPSLSAVSWGSFWFSARK